MNTNIGKNRNGVLSQATRRTMHRIVFLIRGIAFALALTVAQSQPAHASYAGITPPDVPSIIQVPAGNQLFRVAHAVGTQDYICLSTGWASPAYGPQATLFDDNNEQILTHFLSPNPDEANTPRPTWQDSRDTSTVWANPIKDASYTPDPTAIPWLLLKVVGKAKGPTGGENTTGGLKPTATCTEGDKALVPYTADYYFYKANNR